MARLGELLRIIEFIFCFLVIVNLNTAKAHRLNVPRVLLPVFNDFPVNFTLEVREGGCYQWSTSRLDIIRLIPMNENFDRTCSSAVIVQTVTKESTRNTAIVVAEDNNRQLLRCDVIVDAIFSFNLVTTTRELFIEEAPEAFEVRAYDEQGNEFTTLAGVEFMWSIGNIEKRGSQIDSKSLNNVLRFLTFQESPYETPPTVAELDAVGKRGHIVLLEGIKTGTAKVSVRLLHAEYKHVPAIEVELIVVANLIILPSDITMMAYDSLKYKILQVHQGRLEEISLPSNQYYLEAESSEILEINNDHGSAYALSPGKTKVFLHDKNVYEEYGVVLPSAVVNVNDVAYITIAVLPYRNWDLILGQTHEIIVELYDNKDHKFHIGEGVEVTVKIDKQYFKTQFTTQNGTHVVGVPITSGTMTVEAILHGIINKVGKRISYTPHLTTRAELTIHPPVSILPKVLAVPWDSKNKSRFEIALRVSGGDGSYAWTSRQSMIATVTQNGVVRILQKGSAEVSVSMVRNQYNRDTTKIHVLSPSKLEIIQYNMEAAVGEPIHLHIALYGEMSDGAEVKEIPFNDCKDISFEVYIPDGNFIQNDNDAAHAVGIACTTLVIVGLDIGTSGITVAYNANGQYLMDNITVSAYKPLVAVHPANAETLLAVGSSRKIIFRGGPHPWSGKLQGYSREIHNSQKETVDVLEHKYPSVESLDISVFEVTCKKLGDAILKLTVSNMPLLPNCERTDATATVHVICGKPRYIYLQPEFEDNNKCPISQNTDRIMAHIDEDLKLIVIVKDEDGRRFDNITSLSIEWKLKPSSTGTIEVPTGSLEETFTDMQVILPKKLYQRIVPKKHTGALVVSAKVTGYEKYILNQLKIMPEWPPFPTETERGTLATPIIEAFVNVILVNDTIISPSELKVLNDPNAKYSLQVSQGSGYYEFRLSSEDIADVRYVEPTRTISIVPKKSGILQIALVDLCLVSNPAEARIEVQQLGSIEVDIVNKVEKGKCVAVALRLYDTNNHIMKLPSVEVLDIKTEIENRHIEIKRLPSSEQGSPPYDQILYMIYGVEEGESQLIFSSGEGDNEIRSEPSVIQVFSPLKIIPRNLTILIGTVYQSTISGGPINSEIEFTAENDNMLVVDRNGVLEGKSIGQTKLIARAVGFDAKGNKIIYSQDHADIFTIMFEGIKIVVPTTRVKVGATIPLWAFGIPDHLTPLIIGSMKTPLRFIWTSSDPNLLSLHNMYEDTGINIRCQNEVTIRAKAVKSGLVTVYLNVTVPSQMLSSYKRDETFTTFIKIEIFEELRLIHPSTVLGMPVISMAPNSVLKLQTNHDKHGLTTYKILSSGHSSESDESNSLTLTSKTVTIDKTGVIKSGENFGRTVLSITNIEAHSLKQTLTVIIDVKPIHYMMLSLKTNLRIRSGEELNMLPKGMELNYVLEYYDNIGSKLHAAETKFKTLVNRADLTSFTTVSRNLIGFKFLDNGELVAKVYDEKYPNGIFDYVHMMIGDILFPTKTTLTVGDVVCFSMPLLSSDGDPGHWQSSAPEHLTLDSITGIGRARGAGRAIVKHSLATETQGEIEVNIQPIFKISFVPSRGKNITGMEIFSLPLVLKSKDERIKENNILSRGLGGCRTHSSFLLNSFPFTCNIQFVPRTFIDIKDIFLVKPRFDIVTGFYYCDIIPVGTPTITSSVLETNVQINVQSRDIEGTPVEVVYFPPVYINTKEIIFIISPSNAVPTTTLEIHGLRSVLEHLIIDTPEGLTVNGPQFISKHLVQYKIRLLQNWDEIQGQKVIVINEPTKQHIPLFIRVSRYDNFSPLSGIHWLDYMYFHRYTFGTFAVLVITFFYMWKNRMTSINLTVKNKNIFADKCPPPIKKTYTPSSPTMNNTTVMSTSHSPNTSLRPFSAFEPVYGDPRGFYTPNARRNRSLHSP